MYLMQYVYVGAASKSDCRIMLCSSHIYCSGSSQEDLHNVLKME